MIKLEKAATKIMAAIGTAVMLFLLFYSWKYTKRLVEPEYYLDEKDSILWNALVGVVLVAVCGALSGVMKKIPAWALHLLAVLGAVTAVILGIRLARAAGAESIADQYYVQRAAMALTINGGNFYVEADGDGLDSNGSITVNGGTTIVCGPTSSGDTAVDFDGECVLNGGKLMAFGSNGMVETPTSA